MDIDILEENIQELENSDTTFENVQELAYLYIIKDHLYSSNASIKQDDVEKELSDILPAYQKYINSKRRYQLHDTDDESMIKFMQLVCQELKEFILSLYNGTSTRKERHYIEETLSYLIDHLVEF